MKIVSTYVGKTVIKSTLVVLVALAGLQLFVALMNQIEDLGMGGYDLWQAFSYIGLQFPAEIYRLFPMAGLIGTLMGLGLLAANSELIVLRAAGLSISKIARSVLVATLLVIVLMTAVGEGIAPMASHLGDMRKAIATSNGQALKTVHGLWVRDGNTFVHINTVLSGGRLLGIDRYTFDNKHRIVSISHAKRADYRNNGWILHQVAQTEFHPNSVSSVKISELPWDITLNPSLLGIARRGASEMSLPRLYNYIQYRRHNGLSTSDFSLNFWQRVLQPITTLVMMLLAIPCIFGPLRSSSMGLRLIVGIGLGFGFYILNQFFGPLSIVYQLPPFLAAILPSILFAMIAMLMLRKVA